MTYADGLGSRACPKCDNELKMVLASCLDVDPGNRPLPETLLGWIQKKLNDLENIMTDDIAEDHKAKIQMEQFYPADKLSLQRLFVHLSN